MTTLKVGAIEHPTSGSLATINGMSPSNRNLIINGAMQVAQRGTSDTSTAGYGCVDRFFNYHSGGTKTQSQESLTSGDPYDEGFRHFLRITRNTSGANTTDRVLIIHRIEAQNLAQSGWNYTSSDSFVTVSFWVRASVSQEYYGYLRSHDGTAQKYVFSLGTLAANTWTKVTKHIPGNSNLTIDNDNNTGIELDIAPFLGTNYTDSGVSVDAWGNWVDSTRTPDYTTTWNAASATFDITGVQLEVGPIATPFEHRSYGDELARCQRYYVNMGAIGRVGVLPAISSSVSAYFTLSFPVTMRASSTLDYDALSDFRIYDPAVGGAAPTSFSINNPSAQAPGLVCSGGITYGNNKGLYFYTNSDGAKLAFSAEL